MPFHADAAARRAHRPHPVALAAAALAALVVMGACAPRSTGASVSASPTADAAAAAIPGSVDAAGAPFVASRRTKKFYPAACNTVALIRPADRVGFASMKDAETAGFARDLYSTDCRY